MSDEAPQAEESQGQQPQDQESHGQQPQGQEAQDQPTSGLEPINRPVWAAVIAAALVVACLCGFAAGSVLISAGVSAYSGWAGVSVTQLAVTVAFVSGPTYTPYPTYTPLPTYTPQPTYTVLPTDTPPPPVPAPTQAPPVVVVTATPLPGEGVQPPGQDVVYNVQEGDTPQSIADRFGVDVVLLIYANGLDPANPVLQAGSQITLPSRAADLCVPPNASVVATVGGVVDGDTIDVLINGQPFSVRYIGIDAPAVQPAPEPFGLEALTANQNLVNGQIVTLIQDVTETNAQVQLPRYVLAGNTFVNYEMVRQGYADAAPQPPDTSCDELFALAADQASLEGLGMWASQASVTPAPTTPAPTTPASTTPTPTTPPQVFVPPPTAVPTATSSLGFNCNCKRGYVWGNFHSPGQAALCQVLCDLAQ